MNYMFDDCKKLKNLNVSCFNSNKVIDIHGILNSCKELK